MYCIKLLMIVFMTSIMMMSCKKVLYKIKAEDISSITVVNGIVGSAPVITDFSGVSPDVYYSTTPQINYGSYKQFSLPSGVVPFVAYQTSDTINAVYKTDLHSGGLDLKPQGIYTLFLCGQTTPLLKPDAVFVTDNPPYHPITDSSIGVRFINLSPGSNPVNVTLSTSATTNEFSGLAYKSITDFKNYSATIASPASYSFQFRDAATNTVLGSFTMSGIKNGLGTNTSTNSYRYRNFTIVLKGLPGGTGSAALGTFLVNNY